MKRTDSLTRKQLLTENAQLRARLAEAEGKLRAPDEGPGDAVPGSGGPDDRRPPESEAEGLRRRMRETLDKARRASDALRASEQRMQQALRVSHSFTFEWQPATDRVLRSESCATILSLEGDQAVQDTGQNFFRRVHPEDRARFVQMLRDLTPSADTYSTQYRVVRGDGGVAVLEEIGQAGFDAAGRLERLVGVATDVTARQQAEEQARRSQETFADLVQRSPFGIYVVDSRFRIVMMNPTSQDGAFRTVRPVIGRDLAEAMRILWPEPVALEIIGHFRHTLETGEPFCSPLVIHPRHDLATTESYEWEVHRTTLPDGQWGVVCYSYDSTRLREAEAALRTSQARLEWVLEQTGVGTWLNPLPLGRLHWDEQTRRLFFVPPGTEPTIDLFWARIHPDDREPTRRAVEKAIREHALYEIDHRAVDPETGAIRWIRSVGQASYGAEGTPFRFDGINFDVTARKEAEAALQGALAQAEEGDRLLTALLENVPEGITIADAPDGRIRRVSRHGQDLLGGLHTGLTVAEVAGQWRIYGPDGVTPMNLADLPLVRALRRGETVTNLRLVQVNADGRRLPLLCNAAPIRDRAGAIVSAVVTWRDITEREVEEQRLAWLASFPQLNPNPIVEIELVRGRVLFSNPASERLFPDLSRAGVAHAWLAGALEAAEGLRATPGPRVREVTVGSACYQQTLSLTPDQQRLRVYGADITERKRAEDALRESESFYRQTLESIPGMVFTTRPDGYCDYQSQPWVEFTGVPRGEHLGDGWNKLLHPEDRPRAFTAWRDAVEGRAAYDLEYRVRRHDGTYEWFKVRGRPIRNDAGQIVRWFGIALNIDDLVKARAALERSEQLYRAIGETIDYGIWVCDPAGRNTYASESFLKLVGLTQEQCSSFGWGEVLHPDDAERTIAAWKECVRSGGTWDIEHRFRGVDGRWHPILARGVPVRSEDGRLLCWAGINLDIGRLKRTEAELRASLGEKEVLLKEIHHRVKNNLQVISSLINLQADTWTPPESRAYLYDLRDRVRSMALVHEKLYESESLARLNFADYATSLLHSLWRAQADAAAPVGLRLSMEPVELSIQMAVPCGLILNELASNALKHAFRGRASGEVHVSLRGNPGGSVTLQVQDDGAGLPPGLDWRRVPSLGLRLVQMLTQQIQGELEVRRGESQGTEFRVTFPPSPEA